MKRSTAENTSETTPRITIRYLWQEVLSTLSWDKGIFFTIKELLIRPGEAIHKYLAGERKRYSNPIRFLVLVTTIASFITIKLDLFRRLLSENSSPSNEGDQQFVQDMILFLYQYYNIIMFLSVPLLAVLTYLFFRRWGYNYAEHLTLSAFLSAEYMVLYLFIIVGVYYQPLLFNNIGLVAWFGYIVWALVSLFPGKKWKIIGKGILISILQFLFSIMIGGVLALVYISLR
ncbi:MAG: DUF3667 domain-containing protein [Bacteroidota bacterium]